jgi:hypothetical protein
MSELIINSGVVRPHQFVKTRGDIRLRITESGHDMDAVYRLTYDCYVAKGYCLPNSSGRLIHYPHLDGLEETTVLVIETGGGEIVGTCSTTTDNPHGLHVDEDFLSEANQVREEGGVLASSWRIAVDPKYRSGSRVACMLIKGVIEIWHMSGVDTALMTFGPCHEAFYRRYANCMTIARSEGLKDIQNTAAVLMRWDRYRCPFAEQYNARVM